jgi:hypothetical protein
VYTCGRYMRTSGAECASNQVDAEAMLRFTLQTLKQLVDRHGNREKLRQKLLERARRAVQEPAADPKAGELARLRSRKVDLSEQKDTISYRMARERDDTLYAALSQQYKAAESDLVIVEGAISRLEAEQLSAAGQAPEVQAEASLALLDDVMRIATNPQARAEINPLLQRLGVRVGLSFGSAVKGKKRVVQRLLSGMVVFGDAPLPVPLFGKDNVEDGPDGCGCTLPAQTGDAEKSPREQKRLPLGKPAVAMAKSDVVIEKSRDEKQAAEAGLGPASAAAVGDRSPARLDKSQPEGISITKGSRGERI